jgi:hypothetical protein
MEIQKKEKKKRLLTSAENVMAVWDETRESIKSWQDWRSLGWMALLASPIA